MLVAELVAYGEPVRITEQPVPEPGPGQVRVRVEAATVNPVDWLVAGGVLAGMTSHLPLPLVLGWDVVGRIEAVGPTGAERSAAAGVGERVAAMVPWFETGAGAFAEQVLLDAAWVVPVPDGVDPVEAATLPVNAQTARQALDLLAVESGQTLLVTGASGAVGGFAVQLATAAGVRVLAVASRGDEERVRGLGAAEVLPRSDDLMAKVRALVPDGVDATLDAAPVGPQLIATVRGGGSYVTVLDPALPKPERDIRVAKISVTPQPAQLAELLGELAAGRLSTRVAQELPLTDAAKALEIAAAGGLRGKVVIVP